MDFEMTAKHSIKAAAKLTGVPPYLIRAWERRYKAVIPERTSTNRRLYSDQDIERLILLYKATLKGESIGQVAGLSIAELRELNGENGIWNDNRYNEGNSNRFGEDKIISKYVELTEDLDRTGLYKILLESETRFSKNVLLEKIIIPFMHKVGDLWEDGSLKVVHEHLASAVVRSFLGELLISQKPPESGPSIIGTTPVGQNHEFGAVISILSAISEGWRGIYLGSNLPAEEIAFGAEKYRARVIALSLVHPADDPHLHMELHKLRRMVGDDATIIAGGRSADNYGTALRDIKAIIAGNMAEYRKTLREIRESADVLNQSSS
ncbi:MAG: MerR family transcriptional regulator [Candidatus Zixiibacteriota bacterium]|nr:MAG: MerR family transcriptional regulator [candidate division Zixibacteria bacterium]